MGSGSWLVIILAIAGIALHVRGIRYLRDPSIVDCTLADIVEVSSRKQKNPIAVYSSIWLWASLSRFRTSPHQSVQMQISHDTCMP